jgi:hypothetical protein
MATTGTAVVEEPRVARREYVRTTIVLPVALDQNLEIFCAKETQTKNQAVIKALTAMLKDAGLEPLRLPRSVRVDVSY